MVLGLLGLGCVGGFIAGLLGVGGGLVFVPGLFFLFQSLGYDHPDLMHLAIGTSLALIVPTGVSSALGHYRKGNVVFPLALKIGGGVVVGTSIGTYVAGFIAGSVLQLIFGVALLFLSVLFLYDLSKLSRFTSLPPWPVFSVCGSMNGFFSALVGIGGGILNVPLMSVFGVPIKKAIGTAAVLGLCIGVPGALGYMRSGFGVEGLPPFSFGYVNALAWLCVLPASVTMAQMGVWATHKLPVPILRRVFAGFMILVSLKILFEALG